MQEIKSITWRDLTGNKFVKALHPAMLSEEKYICTQRIRRIGESAPDIFKTTYDREYAIEWLARKICKTLSFIGKERLIELIDEAWILYAKETLNPYQNEEK